MKKHYCIQSFRAKSVLMRCMKKIPLAMRCTLFMLFCLVGMTFANEGYAQKTMVNIALEDKTVDEVLTELEQGTEFVFFYNNKQIDVKRRVSVRANNKTIFKVLNDVFKGTNIGYKVLDRNIILYDKAIGADGIQATLQAATVKGSVVDATGEPVIGASILVQGTTNGVITDIDGNFILTNVGSDATLIISYVGYKTQNIKVAGRNSFKIVLVEDAEILDEVVVVGYGVQKKESLTGAIAAIGADEIATTKTENLISNIQGKMPGLLIRQKTGEPGTFDNMVSIRGYGDPLVVIDGITREGTEELAQLNSEDIESISILKDASAAIYGMNAANGVIIVTTKKGVAEKTRVSYSALFGMKNATDADELKENKGSGFGLMNCKGIIEKYKKTNELFRVCVFNVESELGKGSRFYFRLPSGVRKVIGVLLCLLLPFGMGSCLYDPIPPMLQDTDSIVVITDSAYEDLLDAASDYANAAYFANVDEQYEIALQYADSAILLLNEHYQKYARPDATHRYMKLVGEGIPAEILWWNELFDSDYHVILDIRNEAAVAFLALKQLDAYSYNNSAFTDLYKLQGEDQTLEGYCRQLERSNINKTVGIILCFVLLIVSLVGYYLLYLRKRIQNRLSLEQVLEINQKVFAASLIRPQEQENAEALQREESTLKEIPQRIVDEAFGSVNELLTIDRMGIAVYNETTHLLEYASSPGQEMPEMVQLCFDSREYISEQHRQAIPLMVEAGGEHQCVGVLYLERREGTEQETDRLLFELVARYVAIVVFNAVVKLATKYRDIESAHEETQRASWEDSMLHVQNMVLDNCLSTIKHETIYYPNKIKQIIGRLNAQNLSEKEEKEAVETMTELIEYYKGIFTILSSCASRQLEEVTFRRTTIPVQELFETAGKYFKKSVKNRMDKIELEMAPIDARVIGDVNQLRFLLENLIDEALTVHEDGVLRLQARKDDEYIRFLFTDTRREKSVLELNQLFYPNLARMTSGEKGELRGTEYLVCKQIIRDHDEFAGRRGCRINAEPAEGGGFTVYFTIPRR